jgi:3-methyladenine DNA glycosylase/8-oxoguanine DNA glycosylase
MFRSGRLTVVLPGGALADAWQRSDGVVVIRAPDERDLERVQFILGLADDHSRFLEEFADDPLVGRTTRVLRGLRPLRLATVAHALLRGLAGQLVTSRQAREIERSVIRRTCRRHPVGLFEPPMAETLGRLAPAETRAAGLHARRAATLVRLCRSLDLERLHQEPTDAVVRRLVRERGLGPWSVGVVCIQGLGRSEHGLVGDLGLVKLCSRGGSARVDASETAALLERYGEWAGLASVYLLAGLARGLVGAPIAA